MSEHGTASRYRKGCRCAGCREAHRVDCLERRHRKNGVPVKRTAMERFMPKVEMTADCWLWTGSLDGRGYGMFRDGKVHRAHRWFWEQTFGPVAQGMELDHLCRTPRCVNPAHLDVVTPRENQRRRMLTHCHRGHEFTPENTHLIRVCRACWKVRRDEKRLRRVS